MGIRTWGNVLDSSLAKRSTNPEKRLPPPVRTTLLTRTWRSSGSQARNASVINAGMVLGRLGLLAYNEVKNIFL